MIPILDLYLFQVILIFFFKIMKSFSYLIVKDVQGNFIKRFKSECRVIEEVQISCLSFVDDTLFFFRMM